MLYDEIKQQLYFEAATNIKNPHTGSLVVPVDSSIAGWIITERQPVIISEAQKDPRHFDRIGKAINLQTTSLLGVPLITKDKVIGVLEAINKSSGDFTLEDQEVLLALGAQAAVAIENAHLFQQSDLISELVHELRTPLASLKTASHLLLRPELNEDQRKTMLKTINQEIERLSDLTTAFLDLARLESGRSQFHTEKVHFREVIREAVQVMHSKVDEKKQVLEVEVASDLPQVTADRDKLKQLLLNLLSNAIKYTPEGGQINLSAKQTASEVAITVRDTGMGIPSDSLPLIFQKFYRVPGAPQSISGTGLGLSICKRIAEAHRGHIDVHSRVGEGTTFTVHLPRN